MVSPISTSSDGDFAFIARGPGRPKIHPNVNNNNRQWRADDNVVDDFIFSHDNTSSGINLDLFVVLINSSLLDFYMFIVHDKIINNIVIETNKFAAQKNHLNYHLLHT